MSAAPGGGAGAAPETAPDARPATRTLVVDDHPIVRQGIVALLAGADDFAVVGQAADGAEAVRLSAELAPDLVVMDLRMPGVDGVAATRQVLLDRPRARVVVLTTYETDDSILSAIEAGASGYLLKAAPEAELLAGLRAVVAGQVALAPSMAALLVTRARTPASGADAAASPLTARETQVLDLVAAGCSNPEIGRRLFIGEATVKTHLLHVFEKLGVADRTRAVTLALERGWLPRAE
ncbi:response regulator [Frigoribacterium sp. CFBP 13707]|uniref:response regulator n=1 Tax=Frigoribacterium sp. CFBP 13707 TaxID=2775313 RepID=UPI0017823FDC|nr:response regulator transcription factor [Frigoribacterium sp. CFBP 13707]